MTDTPLVDQWIFTWCRYGVSGMPGLQVYTCTDGVTAAESKEMRAITEYHLAPELCDSGRPAKEKPIAFGLARLHTGRYALYRSVDAGGDGEGRAGNYVSHALIMTLETLNRIGSPTRYYEASVFVRPPIDSAISSNLRQEILPLSIERIESSRRSTFDRPRLDTQRFGATGIARLLAAYDGQQAVYPLAIFGNEDAVLAAAYTLDCLYGDPVTFTTYLPDTQFAEKARADQFRLVGAPPGIDLRAAWRRTPGRSVFEWSQATGGEEIGAIYRAGANVVLEGQLTGRRLCKYLQPGDDLDSVINTHRWFSALDTAPGAASIRELSSLIAFAESRTSPAFASLAARVLDRHAHSFADDPADDIVMRWIRYLRQFADDGVEPEICGRVLRRLASARILAMIRADGPEPSGIQELVAYIDTHDLLVQMAMTPQPVSEGRTAAVLAFMCDAIRDEEIQRNANTMRCEEDSRREFARAARTESELHRFVEATFHGKSHRAAELVVGALNTETSTACGTLADCLADIVVANTRGNAGYGVLGWLIAENAGQPLQRVYERIGEHPGVDYRVLDLAFTELEHDPHNRELYGAALVRGFLRSHSEYDVDCLNRIIEWLAARQHDEKLCMEFRPSDLAEKLAGVVEKIRLESHRRALTYLARVARGPLPGISEPLASVLWLLEPWRVNLHENGFVEIAARRLDEIATLSGDMRRDCLREFTRRTLRDVQGPEMFHNLIKALVRWPFSEETNHLITSVMILESNNVQQSVITYAIVLRMITDSAKATEHLCDDATLLRWSRTHWGYVQKRLEAYPAHKIIPQERSRFLRHVRRLR